MTEAGRKPRIAVAVVVRDGRVLMVRRRVAEGAGGELSWQFPAGEVEPGETAREAAVREVAEETGLVVRAVEPLGERTHPVTRRSLEYWACEVVAGTAKVRDAEELDALAWCARHEVGERVPHGLYGPVRRHLEGTLTDLRQGRPAPVGDDRRRAGPVSGEDGAGPGLGRSR
ncbi:NUDIX domain-containing protein [Streptomyces sp. TRM43335]|uniref:NUDIX domain-containing protein n=1 Tax=Streptomyces taklimakanensis TaxID=2569853 RepID=A0A6G2BBC7_9ACTN|nr:NUDIX domain-containing protein [Streptomyces taklimakanensis]